MENQNIKKGRGRPKHKTEDKELILLQQRQHNYYLNYKNKKKNIIDEIIEEPLVEKEEEKDETIKRYELSYNTKKLNELLDEVIILMNKIKSLN